MGRRKRNLSVLVSATVVAAGMVVLPPAPAVADTPGDPYAVTQAVDSNPSPTVFETTFVASEAVVDTGNGVMANMWTINGTVPGPEIRVKVGDTVIVHFENQLPQAFGIHWHGIELDNISDGTAITQDGVPSGGSYLYKFITPRPGVFWYHTHDHPTNPTYKGLYGSLIVQSPDDLTLQQQGVLPGYADTHTLVLSDTTVCKGGTRGPNDTSTYPAASDSVPWAGGPGSTRPAQVGGAPSPKDLCETHPLDEHGNPGTPFDPGDIPNIEHADLSPTFEGQTVLTNGQSAGARAGLPTAPAAEPDASARVLSVQAGQGERLQVINAATIRYMRLLLTDSSGTQVPLYRVGGEGGLLDVVHKEGQNHGTFFGYAPGEILLGPGNRADLVVKVPDTATGVLTLWTTDSKRTGQGYSNIPTVPVMHLRVTGTAPTSFAISENEPLLTNPAVNHPVEALPAGGGLTNTGFGPGKEGSANAEISLTNNAANAAGIDGVQGNHDGGTGDYRTVPHVASTRYARIGDVLELSVKNGLSAHHPFHLHGFSMQPYKFVNLTTNEVITLGYNEFVDEVDIPGKSEMFFRTRVEDRPMMDGSTPGGVIGRWVFHCHIFFHAAGGMISEIVVLGNDGTTNEKPFINANVTSVTINAGDTANVAGTWKDPEGDAVTLSASSGTITENANGTWGWSGTPPQGLVYVNAKDSHNLLAQTAFLVNVVNTPPTVTIDPGQATTAAEGQQLTATAHFSDGGSGATYTSTIDFGDGDGQQPYTPTIDNPGPPATTGTVTGTHTYGDNGSYTVTIVVSDGDLSGSASFTVTVSNVNPVVSVDPGQVTASLEGDVVTLTAHFTDPGWKDSWTGTIDPDTTDATPPAAATISDTVNSPPQGSGTVSGTVTYGDNGTFPVRFTVRDDDGGTGTADVVVTVSNIDPTGVITGPTAVTINGVPTVITKAGQSVPFKARVTDPGSDDLTNTWAWADGTPNSVQTSLVNPPATDPAHSPSVQPRDVTDAADHAFGQACLYSVGFSSKDDDGGSAADSVKVIVQGNATRTKSSGYWQTAYASTGSADFTPAQLDCFLKITGFVSTVFDETRNASTRAAAYDVMLLGGNAGSEQQKLDRELLGAWLNFANGSFGYSTLYDTNNDKVADTSFAEIMGAAEVVRNNPAATKAQLQNQRQRLQKLNEKDA